MRAKFPIALLCAAALLWPAAAAADDAPPPTVAEVPTTTIAPPPAEPPAPQPPTTPPAPPAPAPPTQEQIDAFLRALVPKNTGHGRRIIYSNRWQRVWIVDEAERLVKSYLVSGRRGMPRAGVYRVYSKSRYASSGSARMEFMVRFARGRNLPIGFHSIPTSRGRHLQTVFQLGTPRSHGCVRQWIGDAAFLYMWAPIGTVVVALP